MTLTTIDGKWLFIGTDRRISECSGMMADLGFDVSHYEGNDYTDRLASILDEKAPDYIVFPILQMTGTIPLEKLKETVILYPGMVTQDWMTPFHVAGLTIRPYLKEVQFVWENAVLTAEGFIKEYYASANRRISGEHFYIAGFGKVGKSTAAVLASLGATVTILARSRNNLGKRLQAVIRQCQFRLGLWS